VGFAQVYGQHKHVDNRYTDEFLLNGIAMHAGYMHFLVGVSSSAGLREDDKKNSTEQLL